MGQGARGQNYQFGDQQQSHYGRDGGTSQRGSFSGAYREHGTSYDRNSDQHYDRNFGQSFDRDIHRDLGRESSRGGYGPAVASPSVTSGSDYGSYGRGTDYGSLSRNSPSVYGSSYGRSEGTGTGDNYQTYSQGWGANQGRSGQYMPSSASGSSYSSPYSQSSQFQSHAGRGPKGYQRSDERIREDVCEMLARHHEIDASEIEVEVSQGIVTLRGSVDERRTKRIAEDVLETLPGVKDIRNELSVNRSLFERARDFIMGESSSEESAAPTKTSSASTSAKKH